MNNRKSYKFNTNQYPLILDKYAPNFNRLLTSSLEETRPRTLPKTFKHNNNNNNNNNDNNTNRNIIYNNKIHFI